MKFRVLSLTMAVVCGFAIVALAQQRTTPPGVTSTQPSGSDPSLPVPTQTTHEELRYQFAPHQFGVNGVLQEIYIKIDCYSGKTWRFHASTSKWTPIPEPAGSPSLEASEQNRYELLTHDYYDTYGEEQELILRADGASGKSWSYRGATGTWKEIEQEG